MTHQYQEVKDILHKIQNRITVDTQPDWDLCASLHKLIAAIEADHQQIEARLGRIETHLAARQ